MNIIESLIYINNSYLNGFIIKKEALYTTFRIYFYNLGGEKLVMVKCIICGVEVPDSADYCSSCGSKIKREQQPAPQPIYRKIKRLNLNKSPLEAIFNMIFSKTIIIFVIALGILFAWIGILIMIFASGNPDIAILISSIGFAAMGFFLISGGIWNSRVENLVRLAMVLMGIFLVVQSLSVTGF